MNQVKWSGKKTVLVLLVLTIGLIFSVQTFSLHRKRAIDDIPGVKTGKFVLDIKKFQNTSNHCSADLSDILKKHIPLESTSEFARQVFLSNGFTVKGGDVTMYAYRNTDGSDKKRVLGTDTYFFYLVFKK